MNKVILVSEGLADYQRLIVQALKEKGTVTVKLPKGAGKHKANPKT